MSETLALAQYMTLRRGTDLGGYRFQNYWVNEDVSFLDVNAGISANFGFLPFVFTGMTVTKAGDNLNANLAFPNNALSRGWAETVTKERYLTEVYTVLINDPADNTNYTLINHYSGQVVSAIWDSTTLTLGMASVLDAVGGDVPRKRMTQQLVGNLPLTTRVRVQ